MGDVSRGIDINLWTLECLTSTHPFVVFGRANELLSKKKERSLFLRSPSAENLKKSSSRIACPKT